MGKIPAQIAKKGKFNQKKVLLNKKQVKPTTKLNTKPQNGLKTKSVEFPTVSSKKVAKKGAKSSKTNPFAKLSEKDPELFDFLKENDNELLDFDMDQSDLDQELIEDSDEEQTKKVMTKKADKKGKLVKKDKKKATEMNESFDFTEEPEVSVNKQNKKSKSQEDEDEIKSDIEDDEDVDNEEDDDDEEEEDEDEYDEEEDDDEQEEADEEDEFAEEEDEDDEQVQKRHLKKVRISEETIEEWREQLRSNPDKVLLTQIVSTFRSAVKCISGKSSKVRAEATTYFNAIFKMVLLDIQPALMEVMKLKDMQSADPDKPLRPKRSPYFKKYASLLKAYLTSLLEVLDTLANNEILCTLLKHMLSLVPFFQCFVTLVKKLLKQVCVIWSEGTEQIRVLAFLIALRMLRDQRSEMISFIMKKLYISYVKNCKFTDTRNLPLINFMKQSLVELYSLDQSVAYQHAFVFLRQCAITLRTAMMSNKKEAYQTVYNWQFIHSLLLWTQTVSCLHPSDVLQPLIFPLVQVLLGTIKLVPNTRYIPLRIHLIKALIRISSSTNTFIPIMPKILDILDVLNRGQKFKVVKLKKKQNLDVILKFPNEVLDTTEFVDICVQKVYELLLEYSASQSHSIAFPELLLIGQVRLKKFIKNWKNPSECKMLKQLNDKMIESSRFIEEKRRSVSFNISEREKVQAWEKDIQLTGTPLTKFYDQWKKMAST